MLEVVLPPLATVFILFLAMVVLTVRRSTGSATDTSPDRRRPAGHVVRTTVGGYLAFLLIVLVFHVWIAGQADAFGSAVVGGGFLALVTLALSGGSDLLRRRRTRDP